MVHSARIRYSDDWIITRKEVASIGLVLGIGLEEYNFKSPSMRYSATFYLPKGSVGANIGANFKTAVDVAVTRINSHLANIGALRGGNDRWRILHRFPLNDLVGGTVVIGTVGASVGPVDGGGAKLKIADNNGNDVVAYEGGSFGVGAGAQINLGTAAVGLLLDPFNER